MKMIFVVLTVFSAVSTYGNKSLNFQKDNWKEINLKTDPNTFEYGDQLKIKVKKSSSPVVIKFDDVIELSAFDFEATVEGDLKPPSQPTGFEEDSLLQLGFVVVGDNQLGAMGKMFAPKWVSELFALAPEGQGLDKVYFFNVGSLKESVGKERQNPKSKYMYEHVMFSKVDLGRTLSFTLPKKLKTTALWIGAEGDATQSEFTTTVHRVILK